ncbi:MauE/DoxX family redox-associated membrane protein [Streptomyces sp. NPDC056254]|uniref:MauE/DoxX family redox-associated membrane protein n=1 Tax=Streptomyces sp. NPDC056254 TaxID=3345763 RepID=UPI0035D80240
MAVYSLVAIRAALGVVFALAATSKIRPGGLAPFRAALGALVPATRAAAPLAVLVIATECAVVTLLAWPSPSATAAGLALAACALVAFTTAIATALRHGKTAPCRCFGASARPLSHTQLGRNSLLLALAGTGLAVWPSASNKAGGSAGMWIALATGVLLGAALTAFDDLTELFTTPTPVRQPPTGTTASHQPTKQGLRP